MKFSSLLKKIKASEEFKIFKKKNPDACLCAGFFVLNVENRKTEQQQLDYLLGDRRIFTFAFDSEKNLVTVKEAESIVEKREEEGEKLGKIDSRIKVELDDIEAIVTKELAKHNVAGKLNKIIAILQKQGDKQVWNLTCMLSNFLIYFIHVNAETGEILKFEQKNLFDFVKKV